MSIWGEVAGQTSAIVLGVGGLVGTYYAGRSTARESRHHSRLETVYADLIYMTDEMNSGLEEVATGEGTLDAYLGRQVDRRLAKSLSLLSIYASVDVLSGFMAMTSERQVLQDLLERRVQDPDGPEAINDKAVRVAIDSLRRIRSLLIDAMREDLAVARLSGPKRRTLHRYRATARRILKP